MSPARQREREREEEEREREREKEKVLAQVFPPLSRSDRFRSLNRGASLRSLSAGGNPVRWGGLESSVRNIYQPKSVVGVETHLMLAGSALAGKGACVAIRALLHP